MIVGKFNVVLDAQWGSSGKGKLCAYLADKYGVTDASSSNMPNAGHTVQFESGNKYIFKALPSALALNKEKGTKIRGWLSPGSSFSRERLAQELAMIGGDTRLFTHPRAQIMLDRYKEKEQTSTKHIASTMQGCAEAMCEKIMRSPDVQLAGVSHPSDFRYVSHANMKLGMWLHEVSQGYALSIDHGTHYPYCTSRNCTVQAGLDQMSVPHNMVGDIYLNFRPAPIRVGNVIEDGKEVGYSGDFAPWGEETTWDAIADEARMPPEARAVLAENERTTVTKRIRRVGTLSLAWLREAAVYNGATKLSLNFANYIDWRCYKQRGSKMELPIRVLEKIWEIEDFVGLPIAIVGTGPDHEDVCT